MVTLYRQACDRITLDGALKKITHIFDSELGGIGLIYSPASCEFVKVNTDGELINYNNNAIKLEDIFEARIFNSNHELRWLNKLNGEGRAALISQLKIDNVFSNSISELTDLETIEQKYYLWGQGIKSISNRGWGKLGTARIGSINVPVDRITLGDRVYIESVEYIQEIDDCGNVAVVEERLTELKVKKYVATKSNKSEITI